MDCRAFVTDGAGAALSLILIEPAADKPPRRIEVSNVRAVDMTIAAGWLSYDSGRPADARSVYNEALAAARIAHDPGLEGHAFDCVSLQAKASGRPREVICAAQGVQTAVSRTARRGCSRCSRCGRPVAGRCWATRAPQIKRSCVLTASTPRGRATPILTGRSSASPPNRPGSKPSRGQTPTGTRGSRPGLSRPPCRTAVSSHAIVPCTRPDVAVPHAVRSRSWGAGSWDGWCVIAPVDACHSLHVRRAWTVPGR